MAESSSQGPSVNITPGLQFLIGAVLAVSVGVLMFLDKILGTQTFAAIAFGYGASATAFGIALMEQSSAIHTYWKYITIILIGTVAYGLVQYAGLTEISPVAIATFVIALASFAANDLQKYAPQIPPNIVNDFTILVGIVVVAATSVANAPAGSIINFQTLLEVAVPAVLIYIFQKLPEPTPPSSTSTPPAGTTAAPVAAAKSWIKTLNLTTISNPSFPIIKG